MSFEESKILYGMISGSRIFLAIRSPAIYPKENVGICITDDAEALSNVPE